MKKGCMSQHVSDSMFVWHHCEYQKLIVHRWNCNIPIMQAGPVWDEALVQHIHKSTKHPPESQAMTYCCFIALTAKHDAQEAGLKSFYDGSIAMEEIPKHGDTKAEVHLIKEHQTIKPRGTLLMAGQLKLIHWHC
jgi:hypothetical protein